MKITLEADYAIRIVYTLMRSGTTLPARKIAEQAGVTIRFSLKILRKLTQSGIVASAKGVTGGYRLAIQPEEISFGRIIECIDGEINLSHCLLENFSCNRVSEKQSCAFHRTFRDISAKLREELYSVKLSSFQ